MPTKAIPLIATLTLTASGALLAAAPVQAAAPGAAAAHTPTRFALQAGGYGSRVKGGSVPASSGKSAFQALGCTNKAGLSRSNTKATADTETGVKLSEVTTRVWTSSVGHAVSSYGQHTISGVNYGNAASAAGSGLTLRGVVSTSHTWHNARGFHASTRVTVNKISLDDGVLPQRDIPVPPRGQATVIPGVGTLTIGKGSTSKSTHGAFASVDGITLQRLGSNTKTFVAHSSASIQDGVKTGLFRGSAFGTMTNGLNGDVTNGQTPLILLPCQGTAGATRVRNVATATRTDGSASGLRVSERALTKAGVSDAFTKAYVSRQTLSGGLRVKDATATAHVVMTGSKITTDSRGTTPGAVFLNGKRVSVPQDGVKRIPGVAKIETHIVTRTRNHISVTAIRITSLGANSTVTNIGHASVGVTPSGL